MMLCEIILTVPRIYSHRAKYEADTRKNVRYFDLCQCLTLIMTRKILPKRTTFGQLKGGKSFLKLLL